MSNSTKSKLTQQDMDQSDIIYVIELLTEALQDEEWDGVMEANEFLKECLGDDGSPIELEE